MDYITEMKIKDNIKTIFNKLKNVKFIKTKEQKDFDRKYKLGYISKIDGTYYEDCWAGNIQDYTVGMTKSEFEKRSKPLYNELVDVYKSRDEFKDCKFYIAGVDYIKNEMYPQNSHWYMVVNYKKPIKNPYIKEVFNFELL